MTTVSWTNAEVVSSVQQTTSLLQAVPYLLLLARFMVDCVTYLWNIITVYRLPLVLSTRTAPVNVSVRANQTTQEEFGTRGEKERGSISVLHFLDGESFATNFN